MNKQELVDRFLKDAVLDISEGKAVTIISHTEKPKLKQMLMTVALGMGMATQMVHAAEKPYSPVREGQSAARDVRSGAQDVNRISNQVEKIQRAGKKGGLDAVIGVAGGVSNIFGNRTVKRIEKGMTPEPPPKPDRHARQRYHNNQQETQYPAESQRVGVVLPPDPQSSQRTGVVLPREQYQADESQAAPHSRMTQDGPAEQQAVEGYNYDSSRMR